MLIEAVSNSHIEGRYRTANALLIVLVPRNKHQWKNWIPVRIIYKGYICYLHSFVRLYTMGSEF